MNAHTPKPTRSEQREAARAKAKALREQHKKGEKRRRVFIQLGVVIAVVVAVGAVVWSVFSAGNQASATPSNAIFNDGLKVGANLELYTTTSTPTPSEPVESPTEIVIYLDYQCPICAIFEVPNFDQIRSWVEAGAATLEVHPISFLDGRGSPNTFSSRAANAALCVSEYSPSKFLDYSNSLFAAQPTEGLPGPENDELIKFASDLNVSNLEGITSCINTKMYGTWIKDSTQKALTEPIPGTDIQVTGTPTILVNGVKYEWNTGEELASAARFAQFVQQVTATETN